MTTAVDDRTPAEKAYDDRVAQVAKETAEAAAHMPTAPKDPRTPAELKTDRAITVLAEHTAQAHVVDGPDGRVLGEIPADFALTNMAGALDLVLTHSAASAKLTNAANKDVKDYVPVSAGDVVAAGSTNNPDGPGWGPDAVLVPVDQVHERAMSDGVRAVVNVPLAEQPVTPAEPLTPPTDSQLADAKGTLGVSALEAEVVELRERAAKQDAAIEALQAALTKPADPAETVETAKK